jgi:hypothetical protein
MGRNEDRPGAPIVIVGAYGAVGRVAAHTLTSWYPERVIVAGRDPARAREMVLSGGAARAIRVDVTDPGDIARMLDERPAVVVMCVERGNAAVARACLERGVHHVDISATAAILNEIAELDSLAVRHAATALLSVGVAPGLSNVLARHCVEALPSARSVDIDLLLGMGGAHGDDSVRWVVANLAAGNAPGRADRIRVRLRGFGVRTVHPFPFSDQYTIRDKLGLPATTRMCFDSAAATSLLFALRSARFFEAARRLRAERLITSLFSRLHFGSRRFVVQARAADAHGAAVSSTVTGLGTARATGVVTALAVRRLLTGDAAPGVRHLDELVPVGQFIDELHEYGMTVHHDPTPQDDRFGPRITTPDDPANRP